MASYWRTMENTADGRPPRPSPPVADSPRSEA
jgi:hypothetical protein